MSVASGAGRSPARPTFQELFTPKLVTVLREGYRLAHLRTDALAGLTVAIVALHRTNIRRLLAGEEHRIELKRPRLGGGRSAPPPNPQLPSNHA